MKYNLFILLPNLSEQEIKAVQSQIKEMVKKVDGKIENIEEIGKRKLSYAIKKVRQGFYVDYVLDLSKDKITELKKELKLNQGILRFELSNADLNPVIRRGRRGSSGVPKRGTTRKLKKEKKPAITEDSEKTLRTLKKEKKERVKISMEELDKKLDNILETKDI